MKRYARSICLILTAIFALGPLMNETSLAAEKSVRSETVYVDLDHDGTPLSILASVYLTNPAKLGELTDESILTDLKNVTGTEQPSVDGQISTWKAAGKDVSYQGKAEAPLPFAISIRYFLNGEEMKATDMAGKSGRVRIEVTIENKDIHAVEVEGETVTMYTPFTVVSMFNLDENFRSVTAKDAKVSNEAGTVIVMGVTLPGLAKSLDVEAEGKLSESFSFEADVTEFELGEITFIAVNGIMDASDMDEVDDVQTLLDGFDDLQEGMNELERGARQLRNGAEKYEEGVGEYVGGVGTLAEGASELKKGLDSLALSVGQMGGMGSMASGLTEAATALTTMKGELESSLSSSMSAEQLAAAIAAADQTLKPEQIAAVTTAVLTYIGSNTTVPDLSGIDTIAENLNAAASGIGSLSGGIYQLQLGVGQLAEGAGELEKGANTLVEKGSAITKGAGDLYQGAAALRRGIRTLNQEGVTKLVEETSGVNVSLSRKDALFDLSDAYTTYSGLNVEEGMGSVKFVLTTEDIFVPLPLDTPEEEQEAFPADAPVESTAIVSMWYFGGGALLIVIVLVAGLVWRKKHKKA